MVKIATAPSTVDEPVLVDPDPFTVIATVLTGVSVALQFVQIYRAEQQPAGRVAKSTPRLAQLHNAVEELKLKLERVERAIRRGSKDPDKEFYDQKFRISLGVMNLEIAHHQEFSRGLPDLLNAVGALSLWANELIRSNPEAAAHLGEEILKIAGDAAPKLNSLIADGGSNREVLAIARMVIDALERALSDTLDQRQN